MYTAACGPLRRKNYEEADPEGSTSDELEAEHRFSTEQDSLASVLYWLRGTLIEAPFCNVCVTERSASWQAMQVAVVGEVTKSFAFGRLARSWVTVVAALPSVVICVDGSTDGILTS
jgi:hypothetical protein